MERGEEQPDQRLDLFLRRHNSSIILGLQNILYLFGYKYKTEFSLPKLLQNINQPSVVRGWAGGAMVQGNFQSPGAILI